MTVLCTVLCRWERRAEMSEEATIGTAAMTKHPLWEKFPSSCTRYSNQQLLLPVGSWVEVFLMMT